jgi:hypothetical protein
VAVIDVDAAKRYLNITTDQDDELQGFVDAAVAAIEALVGPLEVTSDLTAVLRPDPCGYDGLILPVLPVDSLISVTPYAGSALDLAGFQVDKNAGLVTWAVGSAQRFSAQGYTVVYRAGRNPVPADLKLAVSEMVRHLWRTQRGSGVTRPGSAQSDNLSSTLPGAAYALPIRVEQLLTPYMFPGFA